MVVLIDAASMIRVSHSSSEGKVEMFNYIRIGRSVRVTVGGGEGGSLVPE